MNGAGKNFGNVLQNVILSLLGRYMYIVSVAKSLVDAALTTCEPSVLETCNLLTMKSERCRLVLVSNVFNDNTFCFHT